MAGYSAFRVFEESVRIDSSEYFLGLRLNLYIAIAGTLAGLAWFILAQRRPPQPATVTPAHDTLMPATGTGADQAPAPVQENKR